MKKPTAGALKVLSGVEPLSPPGESLSLSLSLSEVESTFSGLLPHAAPLVVDPHLHRRIRQRDIYTRPPRVPGSQYASSPLK